MMKTIATVTGFIADLALLVLAAIFAYRGQFTPSLLAVIAYEISRMNRRTADQPSAASPTTEGREP